MSTFPESKSRCRSVLLRAAAAVVAGLLVAVGFEPYGWFWLILPGVVLFTAVVRATTVRRAGLLGFCFGLAFMLTLLPWIQIIGYDAWVGLGALEASFFAFVGVGLLLVSRLPGWPFWSASLWLLGEELRSVVPWGGFPWGRLAFASVDTPYAPLMPYIGTAGTSFAIALTAFGLYGLVSRQGPIRKEGAIQTLLVAAAMTAAGLFPWSPMSAKTPPINVAAVQGNVPGTGVESFSEQRVVLNNHVEATLGLAARVAAGEAEQPDLVLWPENSTDIDPFRDSTVYADISAAVNAVGVPTLVGAMVQGEDPHDVFNQGIVWTPGLGAGESYSKRHPVPFGEYIPLRDFLAQWFQRLDQIPRDMVPGTEPGILELDGAIVGDIICFEVAYDDLVYDVVRGGAGMLVVQTNNATYMGTGQIEQQFATARLRALETGRYVVVVATNGVSGIVDPTGKVIERLPTRETAIMQRDVPQMAGESPAVKFGVPIRWALGSVGLLAMLWGLSVQRRRRGFDRQTTASREENHP